MGTTRRVNNTHVEIALDAGAITRSPKLSRCVEHALVMKRIDTNIDTQTTTNAHTQQSLMDMICVRVCVKLRSHCVWSVCHVLERIKHVMWVDTCSERNPCVHELFV